MADRLPGMDPPRGAQPPRGGGICIITGDPQSVDVTAGTLPAKGAVGLSVSSLFQSPDAGFVIPLGNYAGINWSRAGRAAATTTDTPSIPFVPGVPIAVAPGREIYLNRSGQITASGVCELIFYPVSHPRDLNDPFFLAALAMGFGGGGAGGASGAFGNYFPVKSALADNDANPTTTRIGANLLGFDGTTWDRLRNNVTAMGTDNAAGPAANTILSVEAFLRGYDVASNNWDLLRALGTVGDAVSTGNVDRALTCAAVAYAYNGTSYDRTRSFPANVDGITSPTLGLEGVQNFGAVYNNIDGNWRRELQADATFPRNVFQPLVSSAAIATVASFAMPADTRGFIDSAVVTAVAVGGATWDCCVDRAGTIIGLVTPIAIAAGVTVNLLAALQQGVELEPGDIFRVRVTAAVGASSGNVFVGIRNFLSKLT